VSYQSEHRRMKPVLRKAEELDIGTNSVPEAIYEGHLAAVSVWCTPEDHPEGWDGVMMTAIAGMFTKKSAYVGCASWVWADEEIDNPKIIAVRIETDAYALQDRYGGPYKQWKNRPGDIAWITQKITELFQLAGVEMLPVITD